MKQVADRAVGNAVASNPDLLHVTTEPTPVSWTDIYDAWDARHSSAKIKKEWIESSFEVKEDLSSSEDRSTEPGDSFDEAFEALKQDPSLGHERRLLGCFVSPSQSLLTCPDKIDWLLDQN